MDVLHITPETDGYEVVKLLANRVSRTNHLALIEIDSKEYMTGGFIVGDTKLNRQVLDSVPKSQQYKLIKSLRAVPYVKAYSDES